MKNIIKQKITSYIEEHLSEKRRRHTYAVAKKAISLANIYEVDPLKAELAALFHDMFREEPQGRLDDYVRKFNLNPYYLGNANLSHSKIAAIVMEQEYGIKDQDIINAVSFHTTGRDRMSCLEKIIYLADAIEPNKIYPGAKEVRKLAYKDLDFACLVALNHSIDNIKNKKYHLDKDTIKARNYIMKQKGEKMNNRELALKMAKHLINKKAFDVIAIDIADKSSFTDYLIVATGGSERHVGTLSNEINKLMAEQNIFAKSVEGENTSGWILLDFGDLIVNILSAEQREKYQLEKVWGDGLFLNID